MQRLLNGARSLLGTRSVGLLLALGTADAAVFTLPQPAHPENLECFDSTITKVPVRRAGTAATVSADMIKNYPRPKQRESFDSRLAYRAIQDAIVDINGRTPFRFTEAAEADAEDHWKLIFLGESDVDSIERHVAGRTLFNGADAPLRPLTISSCSEVHDGIIHTANYYLNTGHPFFGLADYQCTAIHEFLHGLGLLHNNDVDSVMRETDTDDNFLHSDRCHSANPTIKLGQVDLDDLDAIYGPRK